MKMCIIRVYDGGEVLTYTFHPDDTPVSSNLGKGVFILLNALKKYYQYEQEPVYATIMSDRGEFFNEKENIYSLKYDVYYLNQACIRLNVREQLTQQPASQGT